MYYDFSAREKKIIHFLSNNDSYVMGKQLAVIAEVSERTIRSDVRRINQILSSLELDDVFKIVSAHMKGYKIEVYNSELFRQFIKDLDYDVNTIERELINFRVRLIRLLVVLVKNLTIYELSHMVFFSEQTILSLIKKSNGSTIKKYYKIVTDKGLIKVVGSELGIRISILSTIFVNPEFKGIPNDILKIVTNPVFEKNVYNTMENVFYRSMDLAIPSLSFQYMAKGLWISYRRNQFGYYIEFSEEEKAMLRQYVCEYEVANEIIRLLEKKYMYTFRNEDVYFMTIMIASFSNMKNCVIQKMNDYSYELCKKVAKMISDEFILDASMLDNYLIESLSVYFRAFKIRTNFDINRQYMGVTRVKRKLITASEYCRCIADELEKLTGIRISDKEMIFLTVCVAEGIEKGRNRKKQKLLVASKYGYCEAKRYADHILNLYLIHISQIHVCELYEIDKMYDSYDLILIDDRNMMSVAKEKYAFYHPFSSANLLTSETKQRITKVNDEYWFIHQIKEDSFIAHLNFKTPEEVFQYIAKKYTKNAKQRKEMVQSFFINDGQLSYECGHKTALIALVNQKYDKNDISFLILENPISWKLRFVQMVIVVTAKSYIDLQKYEIGLQNIMKDTNKCNVLINEPNRSTLKKILNVEE